MALMAATGSMALCLGAGLLLIINLGLAGGCLRPGPAGQALMLLEMAGSIAAAAIPLGLVNWQLLGRIGREDSIAYTAAGLVEGLAFATAVVCSVAGEVEAKHLHAFLVLGAIGAGIGWTFWRFARDATRAD
jgi:hypothetical protein